MRIFIIIGIVFISISSCGKNTGVSADQIIKKTIKKAGGPIFENVTMLFTFRDKNYRSSRNHGEFRLERFEKKSEGLVHDILDNKGLARFIDNCPVKVVDSMSIKISDGVNSVHYFANLPYGLEDPAVNKELVRNATIKGNLYYKIKVTFDQQGGGTDFEDEFMYWIHQQNFTIDYLAYKYEVNGGGIRFREAYNPRVIGGIRFVDYKNYKIEEISTSLSQLDSLFEKGMLTLLSKIDLEEIYVYPEMKCC